MSGTNFFQMVFITLSLYFYFAFQLRFYIHISCYPVYTAKNNYGAVLSLWLPVILVCSAAISFLFFSFHIFYLVKFIFILWLMSPDMLQYNPGLFYGYSNLVFYFLNHIWWLCRGLWSPRGGNYLNYFCVFLLRMVIFCVNLKWGIWMLLHKPYTVTNLHVSFEMRHLDAFLASMLHILVR